MGTQLQQMVTTIDERMQKEFAIVATPDVASAAPFSEKDGDQLREFLMPLVVGLLRVQKLHVIFLHILDLL